VTRVFARVVVFLRWPIVLAWIAGAYLATTQLPSIEEAGSGGLGEIVPAETDAIDTELRAHELFSIPVLARTLVVQREADGLDAAAHARVIRLAAEVNRDDHPDLLRIGGALAITNALGEPPFSREDSTTAITYLFFDPDLDRDVVLATAGRLVDRHIPEADGPVGVTGAVAAREARDDTIADRLPLIHVATLLLVTLVVAVHFRSVVAPLVNLAAVGTAYLVSTRVLAALGEELDVSVPGEVTPVIVALLFGVMTDYTVFFLSPFRRRLEETDDVRAAAQRTIAEQLPIVLTAGIAVAAASGTLIVAKLEFFRAFGPGIALATLIGVAVALTLVPALVAIFGRALFWPRRPERMTTGERRRAGRARARGLNVRVLRAAARWPLLVALLAIAVLLAGASGIRHLEVGNPLIRELPADSEPRQAYEAASRGFAPGILAPTMILAEAPAVTLRREELKELQSLIERHPGVAEVLGPREQPVRLDLGAIYSPTTFGARYVVVFEEDPYGAGAIEALSSLRDRLPELAEQAGLVGVRMRVAGDTAIVADTVEQTKGDLLRISIAVLVAVTLVLALFLRALVAPLYLVAASVLALAATLGVTAYVFQGLLGEPEVTFYVPFAAAVLLVALGSDYNIFVAGRIWLEASRRPLREAIVVAGETASSAIAAAALVLAGSFALLALVPLGSFRELAFTMAAGLLIDAFVVRTVLVPALIALFGQSSGWPGGALRGRRRGAPAEQPGAEPAGAEPAAAPAASVAWPVPSESPWGARPPRPPIREAGPGGRRGRGLRRR
jgi:putative drug exporter of the RND superfamily